MRRKLLLSNLATALLVTGVVRAVVALLLKPQLRALPSENLLAQHIMNDFTAVLLISALVVAAASYWVFERLTRRRLSDLGQQLTGMTAAADASARVDVPSDPQIAGLARPVNHLLGSLKSAQAELAERQLQLTTSEQRLSLALEATGDGLWDYQRGERSYFSDTYYQMLGYPADGNELQPENWLRLVHADDLSVVEQATDKVRCGDSELLAVDFRIRTAEGAWKWIFLRGRVISRSPDGRPLRMIGTVQDIDRRRQADEALRENQELFRNAFEESAVGMAMVKPDGSLMRVNPPFCTITGYTEAELLRLTFQDITHPDDLQEDIAFVHTVLRGERQHYSMEKRYVRKDGAIVWVLLNVGVVRDTGQAPLYLIAQVQDITSRKQSEADLQAYASRLFQTKEKLERSTAELFAKTAEAEAAKLAAEQAARTKSAFLANISHEIRTPMAAIIGFANLLQGDDLTPAERAHSLETIARQGQHMLALINDILDLSKIEAGKMTVECIECDPAQVVADVEAMTAAKALDKNLPLVIRVAPDVPKRVRSDPTRLRQILLNLVSNAIKFTHAGRITVDLSRADLPGGGAGLRLVVTDTGIGMNARQLDRLFEPFSQADASTTRRFGGTGLGLAISRRLVEMMRGTISVRSSVGRGSTFDVRIEAPACEPAPAPAKLIAPTPRPGLRVLLAEDGADNQRLISFYLRRAGIDYEVAENGRVAVERAVAARAAGRPFDLVLMDMQMPEMDGCQATAALRKAGLAMPVLALTAHGTDEARIQSLRAGCSEHLVKPIDPAALLAAIADYTTPESESPDASAAGSLAQDPRFKALLAEYVAELPGQVSRLVELSAGGKTGPLRRLIHQIKGAGGGYGLSQLSVAAAGAEAAFNGADVDSIDKNVDALIRLMRSVQGYDRGEELGSCSNAY